MAVSQLRNSDQAVEGSTPAIPVQDGQSADVQGPSTVVISTESLAYEENLPFDTSNQSYQHMITADRQSLDDCLNLSFNEIPDFELGTGLMPYQRTDLMSIYCNKMADMAITGPKSSTPWVYQPSNTSLFTTRAFVRPDHVSLVSLAMRILRSYPSMMLISGRLPPFINRPSCPWAQPGERNQPQQVGFSHISPFLITVRHSPALIYQGLRCLWRFLGF
jgi:hypothetical protein